MFVSPVPAQVNGTLFLAPLLELLRHPLLPFRVPTEGKVGLSSTVPEVICSGPYANEDTCILHIGSNFRSTAWRWGDAVAVGVAAVAAEFAPGLVCFHCRYLIGSTLLEKRVTPPGDRLHSPAAGGSDLESVFFVCVQWKQPYYEWVSILLAVVRSQPAIASGKRYRKGLAMLDFRGRADGARVPAPLHPTQYTTPESAVDRYGVYKAFWNPS